MERPVAFKVLLPHFAQDVGFLERFRREAHQLATLRDHSRVVDIYDSGELPDGGLFIVMEYLAGPTLRQIMTGPLPVQRAVALGLQIAEGLREAHRSGIIHRDIKPENIKVWDGAEGEALKILDFGIAQALDPETWMQITHSGAIIGSPQYMAPESIQYGQYSELSDLYSWGIVVYEMLAGKPSFLAPTAEAVKFQHVHEAPPPLRSLRPETPAALEQLIMNALEKQPSQRPQHIQMIIAALRSAPFTEDTEPTVTTALFPPALPREEQTVQIQPAEKEVKKEPEAPPPVQEKPLRNRDQRIDRRSWRSWALLGLVPLGVAIFWGMTQLPARIVVPEVIKTPSSLQPSTPKPLDSQVAQAINDHLQIGQKYMDRGEYPDAMHEFEAVLKLDPANAEALDWRERAHTAQATEEKLL
ncbi:MAG: protein kinase [Candidatus Binatia bacterium]